MTVDYPVARALATTFVGTLKTIAAHKRQLPRPHPHADHGALPLLYALEVQPLRISALAEAVHSDISTVSRQVSALCAGRLTTKVADTQDRRAQLVALSPEGEQLIATLRSRRGEWMQDVLVDWTTEEALELDRLLTKFSEALTAYETTAIRTA